MEKTLKHLQSVDIELLDDYVKLCYEAMRSCKESNSYNHSENDKDMIFERDFIISLAYAMGRLEAKRDTANYLIGGEINKYVFDHYLRCESEKEELISKTQKQLDFKTDYVTPDFLIHKYKKIEEIKENGGQKLVIEAKTKRTLSDNDFYCDFFKLNVYLIRLNFEYAVYIMINQSVDSIDTMLDNYINKGFYVNNEGKKRLIFLIQDNEEEYPQSFQFK